MRIALPLLLVGIISGVSVRGSAAETVNIDVGGVKLAVPAPANLTSAPPDSETFQTVEKAAQGNKLFALFLPAEGANLPAGRSCNVQVNKAVIQRPCSKLNFEQARRETIDEQKKLKQDAEATLKAAGLDVHSIESRPIHDEGERHLSYTMVLSQGERKTAVVTSILLLKARLLYCYVNTPSAGDADIQWAESTAKDWIAKMIAANPSDPAADAAEARKPAIGALTLAILIAIGGLLALMVWLLMSRRNRRGPSDGLE